MDVAIVVSLEPVTLAGGAELSRDDLIIALKCAPTLVAADGGGDGCLAAGELPVAVIGDMDSLSEAGASRLSDRIHKVSEQESTDFDKALRHVSAPLVLAVGFTGGRLDHELSVMTGLVHRADRACIVVGAETIAFLCPPRFEVDLPPGTPVSLFPMGPVRAPSRGLRWPTDGLDFAPGGRIGTSNEACGPVSITPDAPLMLVILPRAALPEAIRSLQAAPRWPAPSPARAG